MPGTTSGTWCRRSGVPLTAARSSSQRHDRRADGAPREHTWIRSSRCSRLSGSSRRRRCPHRRADRGGRLGRLPLYWLGRGDRARSESPGLLALAYLAYPWTAWTAVDAFHPVTLAIPLLLFCIWFLDTDRLVLFAVCADPAQATGELMALGSRPRALVRARARSANGRARDRAVRCRVEWSRSSCSCRRSRAARASSTARTSRRADHRRASADRGDGPTAISAEATSSHDLLYVVLLAVPLGGLFLLAPGLGRGRAPQLAANLLAADASRRPIRTRTTSLRSSRSCSRRRRSGSRVSRPPARSAARSLVAADALGRRAVASGRGRDGARGAELGRAGRSMRPRSTSHAPSRGRLVPRTLR